MSMQEIDLGRCDLNLLLVFDTLMRERHVGRAAERLFLSQSATSHALGRLREMLGDPLFVRHPKGISPTTRAMALAPLVSDLLVQARLIVTPPAPFDPARITRAFKVGATDYATVVILAPLLARLQSMAPGFDLQVLTVDRGSVAAQFDSGSLDFALGNFTELPKRLDAVPLLEERFVGVVRTGHPALREGRMSLNDFVATPHALVSFTGDPHGRVDEALERIGRSRRVALTVPHFLALPFVIAASDMIGVLAERVATLMADKAALELFDLPLALPPWTLHLVRSRPLQANAEIAWFSDFLLTDVSQREQLRRRGSETSS